MKGLIDFMHDTLFDGGLRGRFTAQIKNPHNKTADIVAWFKSEEYDIQAHEVEKLLQINNEHEGARGPAKPIPYY